jgi:hypothetical protein
MARTKMSPMVHHSDRVSDNAFIPFVIALVSYLVLALLPFARPGTLLWVGFALIGIPIFAGLTVKTFRVGLKSVGWAMALYAGFNIVVSGIRIGSGESGGHVFAGILATLFYSLVAGSIAGLAAYLLGRKNQ